MREARIILPMSCEPIRVLFEAQLLDAWGGFTVATATGGWRDASGLPVKERVRTYDIAMGDDPMNRPRLEALARWVVMHGKQECVYVRFPTGEVELVS